MMTNTGAAPWIGMPAQMDPDDDKQYLSRHYPDAIAASGGLPVMIPLLSSPESIHDLAERLDGILLTGNSSDLDPALYDAPRLDACGPTQPLRDVMDFFLLETAMKREIPILAICFGIQSLNAFLGGTLIQDIPTAINTPIRHSDPGSKGSPSHKIRISSGSILETLAGGLDSAVNSTHHQSIERPGVGLEAIAYAPDGVIESVFGTNQRHWILGVQWHPEKSFGYDDFSRHLFKYFVARCRALRGIDEGTHT
jgi:putative glutamine amidotransferase